VQRVDKGTPEAPKSVYEIVDKRADQPLQKEKRAGIIVSAWPLFYNTMFSALPRTTAAQAYRAFLGLDIAKSQGLFPIANEPVDYDDRGVTDKACASCHSTLEPLAYPFATYNGIQGGKSEWSTYDPNRITKYFVKQFPKMASMPTNGFLFGKPVKDLLDWAKQASESDAFLIATVNDYYKALIGSELNAADKTAASEHAILVAELKQSHSVEKMLHRLIDTEAYGAP
jgi:hypothetical protein